jgi:hypothetical protein|tara:strand:- start:820 stop:1035 length:216 start_codon:yes stop_codon:yes gene_type:complete
MKIQRYDPPHYIVPDDSGDFVLYSDYIALELKLQSIYNQAIDAAAEVVRERFDEQEPWLEVEDILKLKVTT